MMKKLFFCTVVAAALLSVGAYARDTGFSAGAVAGSPVALMMDDMGMGMQGGAGGMKKMEKDKRGAPMRSRSQMAADAAPGTDQPAATRDRVAPSTGMDMMGRIGNAERRWMPGTAADSSLPGFPGASHLYHIGATGFFLDHPDHVTLTQDQQSALNRIRERSVLEQATFDRRIDEAEQELWSLTAADKPELARIDAGVRGIEKLRGDQRIAFIKAVGDAGTVLTQEQQKALLGMAPSKPASSASAPPAHTKPPAKLH